MRVGLHSASSSHWLSCNVSRPVVWSTINIQSQIPIDGCFIGNHLKTMTYRYSPTGENTENKMQNLLHVFKINDNAMIQHHGVEGMAYRCWYFNECLIWTLTMTMMNMKRGIKEVSFTKEYAACSAFPHQVHGPGQGARAGKCPSVHVSLLVVEAATAGSKYQVTRVSREPVMIRQ